jgi:hypothetical protein
MLARREKVVGRRTHCPHNRRCLWSGAFSLFIRTVLGSADLKAALGITLLISGFALAQAQSQTPAGESDARARELLEAATRALGGEKYLGVRSVIARGLYSRFNERGDLQAFVPFVDYIVYPDRERTEFGKGKDRFIQTNVGARGWIYDGESRNLRDQKEEEVAQFLRGLRRNIDTIMRGSWRTPGTRLRFLGERELWFRQRGVGVEISFPTGDDKPERVEVYFDPQTKLPVRVAYDDQEDRFYLYQDFGGIKAALRIDHFKGEAQVARISIESIEFNAPIDPTLFDKPAGPHKIK